MDNRPPQKIDLYNIGKLLLIVCLVVFVGFLALNQFMEFKYKAAFIQKPCELCADLNKNQSKCIGECFIKRTTLFPDGNGGWKSTDNKIALYYNISNTSEIFYKNESNFSQLAIPIN